MAWNYQRDESKGGYKLIAEGNHRIRIASAEKVKAKTGKDMLTLKFDVSGYSGYLFHNIVFLPDRPEITNRNLTQFFDAFPGIQDGDFNTANWIGKIGACCVKHEEYNRDTQARVKWFVAPEKAASLPAWVEPERQSKDSGTAGSSDNRGFVNVPDNIDEECPF